MQENVNRVMERGEDLDALGNKAADLESGALQFSQRANHFREYMWCKNDKLKLLSSAILLLVILAIIIPIVITKHSTR
ncbi:Vesicle membrane receptor protein (v-SNARE) [Basidiobolus ranarum]|uniref:Vesicle membrane receptor protein (V-SNARE) n=1 Tax=Basidiobolus ranarum TaxID=34480 RepID=A0ABR2W9Q7_9FUNG